MFSVQDGVSRASSVITAESSPVAWRTVEPSSWPRAARERTSHRQSSGIVGCELRNRARCRVLSQD
jgi:hypothetical protein